MAALEGGAELREVAVRMRAVGMAGLQRRMYRNIRIATLPAGERVRASAMAHLPRGGGLNEWVASSPIRTSVLSGARTAGVTLRMRKTGHDVKSINAGIVRHPTYGHEPWRVTNVAPGFWSKPLEGMQPEVTAACLLAMREAAIEAGFR